MKVQSCQSSAQPATGSKVHCGFARALRGPCLNSYARPARLRCGRVLCHHSGIPRGYRYSVRYSAQQQPPTISHPPDPQHQNCELVILDKNQGRKPRPSLQIRVGNRPIAHLPRMSSYSDNHHVHYTTKIEHAFRASNRNAADVG